jgi:hypothetical protein
MTDTFVFEDEVVGGCASNHPILPFNSLNACHSERSEESPTFSRSVVFENNKRTKSILNISKQN